jgi:hypothetical protein
MANTIDFNVNTNAVTVLNQIDAAAENTAQGFSSAKAELRALQQQLLQMDSSSAEFQKAAARAAELKDNIGDLSAEINANAGNAFEGLSNNVGLFGSRLMDLDLKGAGQALSGMGAAVAKIDFKTLKDEIGGLVKGFGTLAKAIIANPILLLATAVALVVANFDDLIKLFPSIENGLTGIDEQQREIAKNAQATADASKKAYENSALQENSLRLQGKSEKEILQIKMKKLETSIKDAKVNLEIQEKQAESQIAASKRNAELLKQIVRGALELSAVGLRMLVAPIDLVLETANKVSETLGFGKITAINLNDEITKLTEAGSKFVTELLIDPVQQEKELKESFDKQRQEIDQMSSDYQGFQLSIKKMDKDAADKAKKEREDRIKEQEDAQKDADAKELERRKKLNEELLAEDDKMASIGLNDLKARADKKLLAEMEGHARLTELKAKQSQEEVDELKKAEDAKAQLRVDALKTSLSIISDLTAAFAGKSEAQQKKAFNIQKGVSIATATIDTYLAAQGAYRSQMAISTPDAPVRAAIAAGIAIAQGLARVAIISKQQFNGSGSKSGGSGGGGSIPSAGGGTTAPSPANFDFLNQQPNQQPPLQAYVVSTQVSSNLEAQQLINNQARLGG